MPKGCKTPDYIVARVIGLRQAGIGCTAIAGILNVPRGSVKNWTSYRYYNSRNIKPDLNFLSRLQKFATAAPSPVVATASETLSGKTLRDIQSRVAVKSWRQPSSADEAPAPLRPRYCKTLEP